VGKLALKKVEKKKAECGNDTVLREEMMVGKSCEGGSVGDEWRTKLKVSL